MSDFASHKSTISRNFTPVLVTMSNRSAVYLLGPLSLQGGLHYQQPSADCERNGIKCNMDARKQARRKPRSPKSPDRFIPARDPLMSPVTPFRVGILPQNLSPEERLLRQRSPKNNPFTPTRYKNRTSATSTTRRVCSTHYGPHFLHDFTVTRGIRSRVLTNSARQVSIGAVWTVGGTSAAVGTRSTGVLEIPNSSFTSGTTAPMYNAKFFPQPRVPTEDREQFESRIALALDIDPTTKVLGNCNLHALHMLPKPSSPDYEQFSPFVWKDNAWKKIEREQWMVAPPKDDKNRLVPNLPFRTLDAPRLRDDFYCSTLAYSPTSGILAVGLAHRVYLWSEGSGVQHPPLEEHDPSNYVTSLSFSSDNGGKSILAISRKSGMLSLWSTFDSEVRFEISHPDAVTCVSFKQTNSRRLSERFPDLEVDAEDLAVGDDLGNIWYYSVEWPDNEIQSRFRWHGKATLLAKISAHTQQICGIAWSPDGVYLATGGNDNACLLFELRKIIPSQKRSISSTANSSNEDDGSASTGYQDSFCSFTAERARNLLGKNSLISQLFPTWANSRSKALTSPLPSPSRSVDSASDQTINIPLNRQKHRLVHSAAVKAIAFAPWQPSLLATGGGSNDRAIHFYHSPSGACLATINVYAQVTSLIWSKTRREIVATFGFAQPEHPFRIAVFAWPSCQQISAIPWGAHGSSWDAPANDIFGDCGRALYAVSYPSRPPNFLYDRPDAQEEPSSPPGPAESFRRSVGTVFVKPRAKEGGLWCSRTVQEGCIIIASSDQSVKFHEVWSVPKRGAASVSGVYGGSEILEGLEGLENPGAEIIR